MSRDLKGNLSAQLQSSHRALPPLLQQVRDYALAQFEPQLEGALTHYNDALYDLSIGARSNNEQTVYFDSMREVRSGASGIEARFRANIIELFNKLLSHQPDKPPAPADLKRENFSLVESDEVEQDVALSSMVTKSRAHNQEALYHLKCRLEKLLPGYPVNDHNNPLGPGAICNAFKQAAEPLELEIKARIVLLKAFDIEVVGKLPATYEGVNELLIKNGVLPEIRSTIKKQASAARPRPTPRAKPEGGEPEQGQPGPEIAAGYDDYGTAGPASDAGYRLPDLSSLLSGLRSKNIRPPGFIPRYSARSGPVVSQDELVRLLAELQASISYEEILHQQTLDIRSAIENIMASMDASGTPDHALETPDEDVINLVAMFFDFALSDPNMPMSFQALIGKLQLPILKLALRDAEFFNTQRHPARMLINEIARLGMGFDDSHPDHKDAIVATIEEIIQTVHDQPHANRELFESMRVKLQDVASKQHQKAQRIERRAKEMASGNARTQAARAKVKLELRKRLKDALLPASITKFLVQEWQKVMLLTYLKHGENSAEWLESLQLVDDLIWSVRNHPDEKSKNRRIKLLPSLRVNLRKGLCKTVANEADMEAIIAVVDQIHDALTRGRVDDVHYDPLKPDQQAALKEDEEQKSWKEMSAVERQQAKLKRITFEFIRKAEALQPGQWMVFVNEASGKGVRCKLSAKLEANDSYVFVNRFGFKTLEKKRKDVALDLQNKRAYILDSRPLFDRALNKIAGNLKEMGPAAG